MITVKQLKEFLNGYSETTEVKWNDGSEIKNIAMSGGVLILSDHRAIGYCTRCGENVYKEIHIPEYEGYCPNCDENNYTIEIEPTPYE